MRKQILLIVVLAVIAPFWSVVAQTAQRNIYFLDVTQSMKGYGGSEDIYDNVVEYLKDEIDHQINCTTEIYILPFQENVICTWKEVASAEGKAKLKKEVENFKNTAITNTNIQGPLEYVINSILKDGKERNNYIVLLTDGQQSNNFGGTESLTAFLKKWDIVADSTRSYLLYVMLTNAAKDTGIIEVLDTAQSGTAIDGGEHLKTLCLSPKDFVKVNLKDDYGKEIKVPIYNTSSESIPEGCKIAYEICDAGDIFNNPCGESVIQDGCFKIKLNYKSKYEDLKVQLPVETKLKVNLQMVKNNPSMIVSLTPTKTDLIIENKVVKTLKIGLKK